MATKKTAKTPAAKATPKALARKPAAPKAPRKTAAKKPETDDLFEAAAKAPARKPAAPKATRVTFRVRAEVGSKVSLAGSFNDWDPAAKPMVDKNGTGEFACTLTLPKGRYEYKFVINGTWCADPECTDWVQNDMGTLNSVKVVG